MFESEILYSLGFVSPEIVSSFWVKKGWTEKKSRGGRFAKRKIPNFESTKKN